MTAPPPQKASPTPEYYEARSHIYGEPTAPGAGATLARNSSFGAIIVSALATAVYPILPVGVRAAIPLPIFTPLAIALGAAAQNFIAWLWRNLIGDLAREGMLQLQLYIRVRALMRYVRQGVITPERGKQMADRLIEAELQRDLPHLSSGE